MTKTSADENVKTFLQPLEHHYTAKLEILNIFARNNKNLRFQKFKATNVSN